MDKMAEENVYCNVLKRKGQNKGLKPVHAPQRRSKLTVERVALVVLSALLLAAVSALIGVSVRQSCEHKSSAREETTSAPVTAGLFSTVKTCLSYTNLCDVNWTFHRSKCYYFSTNKNKVSWGGGRARCQDMGGDLVKIDSREEQSFLFQKLLAHNEGFWIGLTDFQTEGNWTWTDGSALNQNLMFWRAEPDNWKGSNDEYPEAEDCVYFLSSVGSAEKSWGDVYCGERYRFVCEKEPACNATD